MARRILLIGGTGLVGAKLAELLLAMGVEIEAFLRRPFHRVEPGWHAHVSPAADWPELVGTSAGDVAISALGTTMRAAGSRRDFRAVDHDLVVGFAAAAQTAGVRHMILVSSVGASAASRNFYLRVKGETERALEALRFDRLDLVRPGLLRGPRAERRPGERIGILLSPLLNQVLRGPLSRYGAIDAEIVAAAIAALAGRVEPGLFIHHNCDLHLQAGI